MDFEKFVSAASNLPLFDQWAWGTVLMAVLAAMGLLLFWELRYFRQRGKGSAWWSLRSISLLLLPLTVGAVIVPARAISGPEALAYFYLALFTLAPALWFGGHVLAGRLVRPAFSKGESVFLAASALLLLFIPFIAASFAQGPIFMASRGLQEIAFEGAPARPLPYRVEAAQRFRLPGVGVILTQSISAPAGLRLERIELKAGEGWYDTKNSSHHVFCQDGQNLHLMWSVREQTPALRIYWRENGRRVHAIYQPDLTGAEHGTEREFVVDFRDDGIDPPAPIARNRAAIAYFVGPDRLYFNHLNPLQPGETFDNNCIMRGYKRVAWEKEGPPQGLALMFYPNGQPLRAEIMRTPEDAR